MTNKKSTKRALLMSVLAMLLCVTMLVGTTFAWFTDSVTSSGNIIKSGTLKVGMYWAEGTEAVESAVWNDASTDPVFNYDKWEPGYAEAKHLKVVNEGSLAFKYMLTIVPNGEYSDLADVIDVYFILPGEQVTDRALDDKYKVGTLKELIEDLDGAAYGVVLPADADTTNENRPVGEEVATVVLKMREDAGNEYQEKSIGAQFAINVIATQYTYENDSFDSEYDADALLNEADTDWYTADPDATEYVLTSAEELIGLARLVNEGTEFTATVKLGADIDFNDMPFVPIGTEDSPFMGTLDGDGHTIRNLSIGKYNVYNMAAMFNYVGGDVVIKNINFENIYVNAIKYGAAVICDGYECAPNSITLENITVSGEINAGSYGAGIAFDVESETAVIKNCTNNANVTAGYSASGIGGWVYSDTTADNLVNNGDLVGGNRAGGIFGNFVGTLTNSENNGSVTANGNAAAGGMVGIAGGVITIENCVNNGDVTTTAANVNASAAGILGQLPSNKPATINNCVNNGNIVAENSYAGGIAVSLYGGITATNCYNSGDVSGRDGAGAVAPKAKYGSNDNAVSCLNAGEITSANGTAYQSAYKSTGSYYYDGAVLYANDGTAADVNDALAALNGSGSFFAIVDGVIIPNA